MVLDENKLFKAHILDFKDKENGTRIIEFEYEEDIHGATRRNQVSHFHHTSNETQVMTIRRDIRPYITQGWVCSCSTAGLHFTDELLEGEGKRCRNRVRNTSCWHRNLWAGQGGQHRGHKMHFEEYTMNPETAETINRAIRDGRRIISVGTTSTRTLEDCCKAG